METLESQEKQILAALHAGEKLTRLDCLYRFGAIEAPTRIWELRDKGHPIDKTMIRTPSGKRVAQYYLNPTTTLQ